MSMKSLGSLTVDLVANDSQWTAGMSRAERSTKRFEEQTKKQNRELERVVSKIDPVVGKLKELERQQQVLNRAQKNGTIDQKQFDNLSKKLEQQRRSVQGLGGDFERSSKSANGLAGSLNAVRSIAMLAAAAMGGFGMSRIISDTAKFGESMNTLRAVTGATEEQYASLERQARTLGATTRYSAQESAEAQTFLARAGFDVNETLSATPQILALATAGQLNLAEAADKSSNVLRGFGLEVEDLGRVSDVLTKAANSSNTNVMQLAEGLEKAGPVARVLNISLEETSAALSALADAGFQGSEGGTRLVSFMRQLSKFTPQSAAALAKYGLSVDDVSLSNNTLSESLHALRRAQVGGEELFTIFGSEAAAASDILSSSADNVDALTESYRNAAGTADEMAAIIGQGLANSLRTFSSVTSESILQLGQGGLGGSFEYLLNQASAIISVWNGMGDIYAETNGLTAEQARTTELLAQAIKTLTYTLATSTAVYWGYVAASKAAAISTAIFSTAAKANPVMLAVSGAAAAIALLYSFKDQMISVADTTMQVSEYMSEVWRVFVSRISNYFEGWGDSANSILDTFGINVSDVIETTQKIFSAYFSYLVNITKLSINSMIGLFYLLPSAAWAAVTSIYDNFVYMFDRVITTATAFKTDLQNVLDGNFTFSNLSDEFEKGFSDTTNVLTDSLDAALNAVTTDYIGNAIDSVKTLFDEADRNIRARETFKPLSDWLFEVSESTSRATVELEEFGGALETTEEDSKAQAKAVKDAENAMKAYENSIRSLVDRLDPLSKKFRDFKSDEMLLQSAMMSNKISMNEYFDLLARLKKEQAEFVKGNDAPTLSVSAEFGGVSSDVSNILKYEEDLNKWRETELQSLADLNDAKLLSDQDYFERKAALEQQYAKRTDDIAKASMNAQLSVMGNLAESAAGVLSTIGQESSAAYKAMFLVSKAASMAQAIVNTEQAATLALAQGGGIAGIPMSSIVRASGYASVAAIGATSLMGMAHDGIDKVPREGTWLLDKGERVTTANTSAKLDKTLDNIQNNNTSNASIVFAPVINVESGSNVSAADIQALMSNEYSRFKQYMIKEKRPGGVLYS